jgi:hypothetical protein
MMLAFMVPVPEFKRTKAFDMIALPMTTIKASFLANECQIMGTVMAILSTHSIALYRVL